MNENLLCLHWGWSPALSAISTLVCDCLRIAWQTWESQVYQPSRFGKGEFPIYACPANFMTTLDGAKRSVNRLQFPLVPGFSFTGYNVQGTTHRRACVDLAKATGRGLSKPSDPYVLLGRITSLSGLYLLRPFEIEVLLRRRTQTCYENLSGLPNFPREVLHISTTTAEAKKVYKGREEKELQAHLQVLCGKNVGKQRCLPNCQSSMMLNYLQFQFIQSI